MRTTSLATCLALLLPAAAHAERFVAGASLGRAQSKADAGNDANPTVGLFGRARLGGRLSAQLELARLQTDAADAQLRTATGALVVEFGRGSVVPLALVGLGLDRSEDAVHESALHHVELGGGVEYRGTSGLRVGLDLRVGERTLDEDAYKAYPAVGVPDGAVARAPATELAAGEYRSVRLSLGVAF